MRVQFLRPGRLPDHSQLYTISCIRGLVSCPILQHRGRSQNKLKCCLTLHAGPSRFAEILSVQRQDSLTSVVCTYASVTSHQGLSVRALWLEGYVTPIL